MGMRQFYFLILLCASNCIFAQSTINSATVNAQTALHHHTFSIGEMVLVSTVVADDLIVTQGCLQSIDINQNLASDQLFSFNVFPNPTSDVCTIQFLLLENAELSYILLDAIGKQVSKKSFQLAKGLQHITIPLQEFASGNYLLNIQVTHAMQSFHSSTIIQKN
jgi:Secretion system C-terminal sorting domain